MRRIDASALFYPVYEKITHPTEIEDARLPAPFISFTASPTADYGVDAFQDQHTNALERAARRGSSLQRLLRRPVRPVPWSGQTGRRRQISDEAYKR